MEEILRLSVDRKIHFPCIFKISTKSIRGSHRCYIISTSKNWKNQYKWWLNEIIRLSQGMLTRVNSSTRYFSISPSIHDAMDLFNVVDIYVEILSIPIQMWLLL